MTSINKQMPSDAPTSQGHINKSYDATLSCVKKEGNYSAQKSSNSTASMQGFSELGEAAIDYAKAGFKVFPLHPRAKNPATRNGHYDATNDVEKIKSWWADNPNYNIGLLPSQLHGNGWLAVLDTDPRNGGNESLNQLIGEHGPLPKTLTAISGRGDGGLHRYFLVPSDVAKSSKVLGSGLDFISSTGYVVAAPSIHPDTLKPYSWCDSIDLVGMSAGIDTIADAPSWMIKRLRSFNQVKDEHERLNQNGFGMATDQQINDLKSALKWIPSDDYHLWARMGMALYELDGVGKELWIEWSKKSAKFNQSEANKKWNGFVKTDDLHFESVFHEAGKYGWINPLANPSNNEEIIDQKGLKALIVPFDDSEDVFEEHPHIVAHILPCGEVTLLAGHGGSGKSFVSLVIAVHVALGLPIGNLQVKQSKVCFFSGEDSGLTLNRRLVKLCNALKIDRRELEGKLFLLDASDIDAVLHRKVAGIHSKTNLMSQLVELVGELDAGLVIIDNASDTFDDDENVRASVRKFVRSLRSLASTMCAVLLLTHVNKASASNRNNSKTTVEDYSGSSAWHNSARSRLSLANGENAGDIILTHHKSNYSHLVSPIGFIWSGDIPLPKGELTKPIEELREVRSKAEHKANKDILYKVLLTCEDESEHVPVATSGNSTSFKYLQSREGFPFKSDRTGKRTNTLLQELMRDGLIYVNSELPAISNGRTKPTDRWRCCVSDIDLV